MRLHAFATTAAVFATGAALAVLAPASPAVGSPSPPLLLDVQVESPATLTARGAAVEVPLAVTCAGAGEASVDVSVTQRAGSEIAKGYGWAQIGCTGGTQTVTVAVSAQPGKAFKQGVASVDAGVFACTPDFWTCGSERDTRTARIKK